MRHVPMLLLIAAPLFAQGGPPGGGRGGARGGAAGAAPATGATTAAAPGAAARSDSGTARTGSAPATRRTDDEAPVVTHHTLKGNGDFRYTATAAMMPIRNEQSGKTEGNILDRKSTRLNSSHSDRSRMPSSA